MKPAILAESCQDRNHADTWYGPRANENGPKNRKCADMNTVLAHSEDGLGLKCAECADTVIA